LESQQKEELAYKLAKEESKAILEDCHKLSCIYKDLEQLINLKIDVYSRKYNKVVLAFLNGVSSVNKTTENEVKICLALEQIYGLTHKYFVAPLSFVNNLIQFQSTQSKMLLNMNSKLYPGGSYSTVTNWLSSQSVRSPVYPQHDCIVAFDNDQIVGKTWNVRANNKVNVSVVTSMCAVEFESKQQFDHSIHPKLWFKYSDFTERLLDIRNREGKVYDLVHDTHYRQLYMNLEEAINLIYKEQVAALKDDYFFDDIDQSIADEPGMDQIKCLLCGMQFKKSKIKCDKCHVNIREVHKQLITPSLSKTYNEPKKRKPVEKEYNFTKKHLPKPDCKTTINEHINIKFHVLDPVELNPNSYESIKLVLRKIGLEAGIRRYRIGSDESSTRDWIFVMCDGLPYSIAHKLIHDSYYCVKCYESIL
jgi:hypothetical protein